MEGLLLKGATVYTGGSFVCRDIYVSRGRLFFGAADTESCKTYDFGGKYIFPGFADVHVHLREPGFSYKETIASGTAAAAAGGYTDVCSMPNLSPVPDCAESLRLQLDIIARDAAVRVHPYAAVTVGERGEALSDMEGLVQAVAFSDDGRGVQSGELMEAAMLKAKTLGKIIAAHCEDNSLLQGGYINKGEYARRRGHRGICAESEWKQLERDLQLAAKTGCAYHACHISCRESVELIRRAKKAGLDVTCETAPHYLVLCEDDLQEDGRFKMNPPLRGASDREALREGVCDGTVDIIATDHAPHSEEEKSRGLEKSLMGVTGLETAFPVLYTHLVKPGLLSLGRLMELLWENPCKRFGLGRENGIAEGEPADFCVYDLDCEYTVDPKRFQTKGRATPFEGDRVYGKCLMTVCGAKEVWRDGTIQPVL